MGHPFELHDGKVPSDVAPDHRAANKLARLREFPYRVWDGLDRFNWWWERYAYIVTFHDMAVRQDQSIPPVHQRSASATC
jgi:hypothetical protein